MMHTRSDDTLTPQPLQRSRAWLVTFTDLVSLMLTFFVLLFSMSTVQVDRWEQMIDALSQSLNPARTVEAVQPTAQYNISTTFRKRAINLDYLEAVLAEKLQDDDVLRTSTLKPLDDRLVISLPGDVLFGPGQALLSQTAREALFVLGGVLANIDNRIGVNGHTDPTPLDGGTYASNWELSLARAVAVGNALQRAGYTREVLAYGYGASHFDRVAAGTSEERRFALARRVDIVIFPTGAE